MRTGSSLSHVAISLLESPSEVLGLSMSSGLWVRWGQGKVTLPGGMGFVKAGPKSQKARAPSMKQGPGWCRPLSLGDPFVARCLTPTPTPPFPSPERACTVLHRLI